MKIPANVIDQLIAGAQSDIRQVLNMLSTWRLSSNSMNFDEGKNLYVWASFVFQSISRNILCFAPSAKMNEKYSMMSPFDITFKMFGPYMFSPTSRESLGDKMELYFHDHAFVPLFIQVIFPRK
jgi:replication factor C subunit 1